MGRLWVMGYGSFHSRISGTRVLRAFPQTLSDGDLRRVELHCESRDGIFHWMLEAHRYWDRRRL